MLVGKQLVCSRYALLKVIDDVIISSHPVIIKEIKNELKVVFDYKWIKVVGVLAKQFKIDHPDTPMPYDIDKMQKKCDALRKEYDEIRKELAPFYPEFSSKQQSSTLQ